MTKKSPERFRQYVRLLSARVSYVDTSRAMGDDPGMIFHWLSESRAAAERGDDPSIYFFEYNEGEGFKWLHEHLRSCITQNIEAIEAQARARALHGTYTEAKFQGRTVYKINPDLEMLGFEGAEAYERDANGKPIPELVWVPPSTDLVLGILAAHSKRYRKQSSVNVNMNSRVTGGVMVIEPKRPAQIAAPLPILEIIDQEPERTPTDERAPMDEAELAELLGDDEYTVSDTMPDAPAPAAAADFTPLPMREPEPEPERVIREPTPPMYAPTPLAAPLTQAERSGRPLSALERDLLSRARGTPEQRAAPIMIQPKLDRGGQ